jgi:hypothetical protein
MANNLQPALANMKAALAMLDDIPSAPADVGAHLDLAICRLEAAARTQIGKEVLATASK